jgi:hypothetical protein
MEIELRYSIRRTKMGLIILWLPPNFYFSGMKANTGN